MASLATTMGNVRLAWALALGELEACTLRMTRDMLEGYMGVCYMDIDFS